MSGRTMTYRLLSDLPSLEKVVDLQRLIWGEDGNNLVPLHMLHALAFNGSPIIGAFDGELLVGFSIGFLGIALKNNDRPAMANLKLASKRLAVHPDYRSAGIGYQLKVEQYRYAQEQGIRLITWTFDPLISRNAYLYIHKLGAICRQYMPDFYGAANGQLDRVQGQSDRLICEWWITSNRVEERLNGSRPSLTLEQYLSGNTPLLNPTRHTGDGVVWPYSGSLQLANHSLQLIEIPADYAPLSRNPELALEWRVHSRLVFEQAFRHNYVVTDFLRETYEGRERSFYVVGFDG